MTFRLLFPFISPILFAIVVMVLGSATPGYDQINYSISRLAIEKYGWIQSLNFIQLAVALFLTGRNLSALLKHTTTDRTLKTIFRFSGAMLIVAAIFPTDPMENVPLDVTILTPTGLVHIAMVVLFLLLSPLGIMSLAGILKREPLFQRYTSYTLIAGFSAFLGSMVWFAFYFQGMYLEYRGIFQKIIVLPVLIWLILVNYAILIRKK